MHRSIEIAPEEFTASKNQTLMELLHKTAVAYCICCNTIEDKKDQNRRFFRIRSLFIYEFSTLMLERIPLPSAVSFLTRNIYPGKISTLVGQISNAFYRKHIEEKEDGIKMVIRKKYLEKLNVSPSKFIKRTNEIAHFFEDFLTVTPYMEGQKIILEFSLIF